MFRITMLPAEDGDCLFVELGDQDASFRMLIDGGRESTVPALLALLAALPPREPAIDVLVLTHVDADHIEGLLKLLDDPNFPEIGDVWFNGGEHLLAAAGFLPRRAPRVAAPVSASKPESVLSIAQGIDFSGLIKRGQRRWNSAFDGGPVMVAGAELPKVLHGDKIAITIIGPPREKLKAFAPLWVKKVEELQAKVPVLKGRPRQKPDIGNIQLLAKQIDTADTAKPNGTSIAFVVEFDRRRVLFAGDAHPDDIADALKSFEPGAGRISFDAVKVAHHGSARNNTSKLIDLLESPLWLVSTSGTRNDHPDPEAIARIVLTPKEKILAFNYRSEFSSEWDDQPMMRKFAYEVRYPDEGKSLAVDIDGVSPSFRSV
jgi:beta-lactamase superfamily II metal-dependent hydrolase